MQQQPPQSKRYQLFPRERQLPVLNSCKALDIEKASNMALQQQDEKAEKPTTAAALKNKISQHSITRRRKVSVPELGPMTTVHEVPMDSRMSTLRKMEKTRLTCMQLLYQDVLLSMNVL